MRFPDVHTRVLELLQTGAPGAVQDGETLYRAGMQDFSEERAMFLTAIAELRIVNGDLVAAVSLHREALEATDTNGTRLTILVGLARALTSLGSPAGSLEVADELRNICEGDLSEVRRFVPWGLAGAARIYAQLGFKDQALTCAGRALSVAQPRQGLVEALEAAAVAAVVNDDLWSAVEYLERALVELADQGSTGLGAQLSAYLAGLYLRLGQPDEQVRVLRAAVKRAPSSYQAMMAILWDAILLVGERDPAEGMSLMKRLRSAVKGGVLCSSVSSR
jgi:tetratricopeptide (TPR) repeat protein